MSSYGFSVVNDANELVVDANSIGYGYVGRAQLVSAGVKLYREVTPYRFSCVMPSSSDLPIAAIVVNDTSVVRLDSMTRASGDPSGRTWYIDVYSVHWAWATTSNTQPVLPQVLVFAPMASMGQAWGVQIFRPDGVTVAWDFSVRPLWIRQILLYGEQHGGYTYGGGNQNMGYFAGDTAARIQGLLPRLSLAPRTPTTNRSRTALASICRWVSMAGSWSAPRWRGGECGAPLIDRIASLLNTTRPPSISGPPELFLLTLQD